MAFDQYTQCVSVKDHDGKTVFTLAVIGTIITALATGVFNPYTLVASLVTLIAYCRWWLYDRLICLGGERCAIGLLGNVEPPDKKTFPNSLDTDYSINLILAPHNIQELPPGYPGSVPPPPPPPAGPDPKEYYEDKFKQAMHHQIADDGIQGERIQEQHTTSDEKTIFGAKKYDFEGYFSTVGGSAVVYKFQPYLHCEFEGGGVHDLYEAAKIALVFATAAAVVCSIPVIGWVACAILAAAAAIITFAGLLIGLNDKGKPSVFDPKTGQTGDHLENMQDILFVRGEWVFDTAHEGWNEIHPIRDCRLVAKATRITSDQVDWDFAIAPFMVATGKWDFDLKDPAHPVPIKKTGSPTHDDWNNWVTSWCDASRNASTPLTVSAQSRPENMWEVHPEVDGCRPDRDPPPLH